MQKAKILGFDKQVVEAVIQRPKTLSDFYDDFCDETPIREQIVEALRELESNI